MTTTAPTQVVAIASGGSKRGFSYVTAAVYELKPRKDGTLTYRRSDKYHTTPHRSVRLARKDAEELAASMGVPLWPHVRQHMTVEQALALTPEALAEKAKALQDELDSRREELLAALRQRYPDQRYDFDVKVSKYEQPILTIWETVDLGCRFGYTFRSLDAALEAFGVEVGG